MLDTFGTRWSELRAAAVEAERAGFDGVWLNDHLAGSVEGASDVLECWTALSALAEAVPRIAVGSLVLNVANRDPGTLAVMAATLQEVSRGRLLLGLGAGAKRGTSFALEQEALGRPTPSDAERRRSRRAHDRHRAASLVGRRASGRGVSPSGSGSPDRGRGLRAQDGRDRRSGRRWHLRTRGINSRGPGGRGQTSPRPGRVAIPWGSWWLRPCPLGWGRAEPPPWTASIA